MANETSIEAILQGARKNLNKCLYHDVIDGLDLGRRRLFPVKEKEEEVTNLRFEAIDGLLDVDRAHSWKIILDYFDSFEHIFGVSTPIWPREEVAKRVDEALMSGKTYETLSSLASLYQIDDKLSTFHWATVDAMMPMFIQENKSVVYSCLMENKRLIRHICNGADQKCATCLVMRIW